MKVPVLALGWMWALQSSAAACPSCAVSSAQRDFWQTFWMLSVMGILPLVIFAVVCLIVTKLQKNEKKTIPHS